MAPAYPKALCKVLIVSDGQQSLWVNALTGNEIADESGSKLRTFSARRILDGKLTAEEIVQLEELLDKADESLSEHNDSLAAPTVLDPSSLARTIWQKIWINTGKEPEKCLYNVVELFVFKFLSDVGVLKPHNNFDSVFNLIGTASATVALKHYADRCRKDIRELFPLGADGTTIINGTIFVNEKGEPNIAQARLFAEVVEHLHEYGSEHGSFKFIQREFKTRLYESFLRQEAGIRFLGQYFTPRNVVRAMVEMSSARTLHSGARICDPFCGVGGFILETIAGNPHIYAEFEPRNGVVDPRITLVGYDKGTDEKEDERTVILAKANMLIYFSDLLAKYNSRDHLKAFSEGAFNRVFHLLRSNLGTFAEVDDAPYDLILTNPPYVTSGSTSLKRAIDEEGLADYYTSGGRGTESLALEWVVRNLRPGGNALLVVPDGLLNQQSVLDYVKRTCVIKGIVSLPTRTFYSTPKKTYVLILDRKQSEGVTQSQPVFTYLVSEIGETRDAKRFRMNENDLTEATVLFNQFGVAPHAPPPVAPRCKIVRFDEFSTRGHWMVDRWWTLEERLALGIADEPSEASAEEFLERVDDLAEEVASLKEAARPDPPAVTFTEVDLTDPEMFWLAIGKRVLKRDVLAEGIPVYSANVKEPFGYIKKSNLTDFTEPTLLWGIDGIFDWGYVPAGIEFASTDHCGTLQVLSPDILPKYLYYELRATRHQYGFDRTYRANLANLKENVRVRIPVRADDSFDTVAQAAIVQQYEHLEAIQARLVERLESLAGVELNLDLGALP
jgi:type I restriction enzyme M protein